VAKDHSASRWSCSTSRSASVGPTICAATTRPSRSGS
jgi:hypothetical protein